MSEGGRAAGRGLAAPRSRRLPLPLANGLEGGSAPNGGDPPGGGTSAFRALSAPEGRSCRLRERTAQVLGPVAFGPAPTAAALGNPASMPKRKPRTQKVACPDTYVDALEGIFDEAIAAALEGKGVPAKHRDVSRLAGPGRKVAAARAVVPV